MGKGFHKTARGRGFLLDDENRGTNIERERKKR
jgi:hypothetical protein